MDATQTNWKEMQDKTDINVTSSGLDKADTTLIIFISALLKKKLSRLGSKGTRLQEGIAPEVLMF